MKKFLAVALLLIFFLNIIGYHVLFYLRRQEVKAEMKDYLRSGQNLSGITELNFSVNNKAALEKLKWENKEEFMFEGEIYDLIDKYKIEEAIIIRCINDKKENKLLNDYEKISRDSQNDPVSKSRSLALLKIVTIPFLVTKTPVLPDRGNMKNILSELYPGNIASCIKPVLTPPPQFS